MKLSKIKKLESKAINEAQKAIDKIFEKYSKLITDEIANEIPKGTSLISINGISTLYDETGKEYKSGKAWGVNKGDYQLEYLSGLQYAVDQDNLAGRFYLKQEINSNQ